MRLLHTPMESLQIKKSGEFTNKNEKSANSKMNRNIAEQINLENNLIRIFIFNKGNDHASDKYKTKD